MIRAAFDAAQGPDRTHEINQRNLVRSKAGNARANMYAADLSNRCSSRALLAVLVFAFAQAPKAHADSDTCLAKAASFVAELDGLLDKVKNHTAYTDLAERYFPFRDCEAEALLDIVRQSRFIRSIQHSPRTNAYHVLFENDFVGAWFSYLVVERKSLAAWRRIHP